MKKNNVLIIGGGISGLSFLHYWKSKNPQSDVCLLEREGMCGGTVHSLLHQGLVFEHGPNGILANQPLTLQLFSDLGLSGQVIEASQSSKKRYILKNGRLNFVPSHPIGLIKSGYLSFPEIMRAAGEIFVRKSGKAEIGLKSVSTKMDNETIYDFASRHFGVAVAEKLFDPLIKGIYGGNARRLHMRSAFPKIACLEQECGSVIRGMIKRKKQNKNATPQKMLSFPEGMQTVIQALSRKYADHICCNVDVASIQKTSEGYLVQTSSGIIQADHVVLCVPAYVAAKLLNESLPVLSGLLSRVEYAPIAVVGMIFSKDVWKNPVEGYGYLVASSEKTPILGVLFEDQVFVRESNAERRLMRVMIGGSDYPDVVLKDPEEIQRIAREHLQKVLGITADPEDVLMKIWRQAIPQYTVEYSRIKTELSAQLAPHPNLHLLANYWNGVSFNDCVENAHSLARNL